MSKPNIFELRKFIANHYNLIEIKSLCLDLDIDYDDLRGEVKADKIRELIDYCRRKESLPKLIDAVESEHGSIISRTPQVIVPSNIRESYENTQHEEVVKDSPTPLASTDIDRIVRNQVFISYSHKDREWLERFQNMLMPLVRKNSVLIWDDTQIKPGSRWRQEINKALASAKVAVLLISPNFLASKFIDKNELPPLLKAQEEGLTIIWVYISSCLYEETKLGEIQAAHKTDKPLDLLSTAEQNSVLVNICREIKTAANA